MKKYSLLAALALCYSGMLLGQVEEKVIKERLQEFFASYANPAIQPVTYKLDSFRVDTRKKKLTVYASEQFAYQPVRTEDIPGIYERLKRFLPAQLSAYQTEIQAMGQPIEELVPNYYRKKGKANDRLFTGIRQDTKAWVTNTSRPYTAYRGLEGRHIALWHSHGKYYKAERNEWLWQRPRLFLTTEDQFTQSFVLPFLTPMLENAGAVVFNPRERDIQRNEVIVDNDTPGGSVYLEVKSKKSHWQTTDRAGFARHKTLYNDGENPFTTGTARFAATERKKEKAFAQWIPEIPETGSYGVYVSYQSLPGSVTDAKYLVFHKGGVTEFKVNQQIGGGTWVYLGTFEFDKGKNDYGMVALSNESKERGVICADAVRFGGGTGTIVRGGRTSGLPRYLEGARYSMQWAGMPYEVYGARKGSDDYADDINTRSRAVNYLSGGSAFNPAEKGLGVPIEMSLGFHTDAGYVAKKRSAGGYDLIGTLGIYMTEFNNGKLSAGTNRYASRDLTDLVLTQLTGDISGASQRPWVRRSMWDRNYSEARLPAVSSMILELLSHQNFDDMTYGHDPLFKFTTSRAVYKGILRFLSSQNNKPYIVQPLPVSQFAIQFGTKKNTVELSWQPVRDASEPTASPDQYIVYQRIGYGGWDNGTLVNSARHQVKLEPGLVYSFKVTALNGGGESFPSEILSAFKAKREKGQVLIVNNFYRLCGPARIDSGEKAGFLLEEDPGLPYLYDISYSGAQTGFDRRKAGLETQGGWGYSGSELEGKTIAGNTFDYPFIHGKAIQAAGHYSFVSCGAKAVEAGIVRLADYPVVDLIFGMERKGSADSSPFPALYQALSPQMVNLVTGYCRQGGNILMSGAFLGEMAGAGSTFGADVLKFSSFRKVTDKTIDRINGLGRTVTIPRYPNERHYTVSSAEVLYPAAQAFPVLAYTGTNESAAIAYQGERYKTFILGFPFEAIVSESDRANIMASILAFLF